MKPVVTQTVTAEQLGVPITSKTSDGSFGSLLTPTTLRSITQILESNKCLETMQKFEETGSVEELKAEGPKRNTFANYDRKAWQGGTITVVTEKEIPTQEEILPEPIVQTNRKRTMLTRSLSRVAANKPKRFEDEDEDYMPVKKVSKSRGGGRKPASGINPEEDNLPPEEKEKLHIRRLRNKEAAARCRKRRVDLTNELQEQVDDWAQKNKVLEEEIRRLQSEREDLEFNLHSHCSAPELCSLGGMRRNVIAQPVYKEIVHEPEFVAVKSEPVVVEPANAPYMLPESLNIYQQQPPATVEVPIKVEEQYMMQQKPARPASLGLMTSLSKQSMKSVQGVAIETPSSIVPNFSFDALVTTGLTPTATPVIFGSAVIGTPTLNTPCTNIPTCSTQQRSSEGLDLSSPDSSISLVSL